MYIYVLVVEHLPGPGTPSLVSQKTKEKHQRSSVIPVRTVCDTVATPVRVCDTVWQVEVDDGSLLKGKTGMERNPFPRTLVLSLHCCLGTPWLLHSLFLTQQPSIFSQTWLFVCLNHLSVWVIGR